MVVRLPVPGCKSLDKTLNPEPLVPINAAAHQELADIPLTYLSECGNSLNQDKS